MIRFAYLTAQIPSLRERFLTAKPFPHVVIDGVCEDGELREVVKNWPLESAEWKAFQKSKRSMVPTEAHAAPLISIASIGSDSRFVAFLEALTGFNGMILGESLAGGGLAEVKPGGSLGMHIDFNECQHKTYGTIYRKLNCLLYLNPVWQPEWDGAIELWDRPKEPKSVEIVEPFFNRMIIFESSERSWHGHPKILACPEGVTRRYWGAYYFVREKPKGHERHSTIYAKRM